MAVKIFVFHHSSYSFKECVAGTVIRWLLSAIAVAVQENRQVVVCIVVAVQGNRQLSCRLHSECSTGKQTTRLSSA